MKLHSFGNIHNIHIYIYLCIDIISWKILLRQQQLVRHFAGPAESLVATNGLAHGTFTILETSVRIQVCPKKGIIYIYIYNPVLGMGFRPSILRIFGRGLDS